MTRYAFFITLFLTTSNVLAITHSDPEAEYKNVVYPNCQNLIIMQDVNAHCPPEYTEALSADMVQYANWDDIRFCTKEVTGDENSECYSGGYYISSNNGSLGSGQAVVPKKTHARIRISNVYFGYMIGTIVNITTGQTLYDNAHFSNGQVIELPYSDVQDQTFKFYTVQQIGKIGPNNHRLGVMVLYIDHINREKVTDGSALQEPSGDL